MKVIRAAQAILSERRKQPQQLYIQGIVIRSEAPSRRERPEMGDGEDGQEKTRIRSLLNKIRTYFARNSWLSEEDMDSLMRLAGT